MENKKVGLLIIGIGIAVSAIVFIFNYSLKSIVSATCSHGSECSMYDTINSQFWLSSAVVGIIIAIGLYVMYSKPDEKIIHKTITKTIKEKNKKIDLSKLDKKEKLALELIQKEGGVIFQADLKEKLEIGKVGMTRLLDKLEAKQIIERKRRGMNNIIIIK